MLAHSMPGYSDDVLRPMMLPCSEPGCQGFARPYLKEQERPCPDCLERLYGDRRECRECYETTSDPSGLCRWCKQEHEDDQSLEECR